MTVFVEIVAEFWDYKNNKPVAAVCNFQAEKMEWAPLSMDFTPGSTAGFPPHLRTVRITDFKEGGGYVGKEYVCNRNPDRR